MKNSGRQREIRVTPSVGKHLHLRIDATKAPPGRISERKIAMHETIARLLRTCFGGKAAMTKCQLIAKLRQHTPRVLRCIRMRNSMMQMDLGFAPTRMAMLGQNLEQALVILFRGIKIGVNKWPT